MTKINKPKSIEAVGDRVIVKLIPHDTTTASGIILPDSANKRKIRTAEIVSIGEPEKLKNVKVGDLVFLSEFSGSPIEVNATELLVVQSGEILAKAI